MELKDMSVEQIKALAFDQIVASQNAQQNLSILNAELVKRSQPPVEKEEATKEEAKEPEDK